MVLVGLVMYPAHFRGRHTLWMLDNTAALMAMVRGRSDSEDLDHLAVLVHGIINGLQAVIYFEWVESASNIIDKASRAFCASDYQVYDTRGWKRVAPVMPWSVLFPDSVVQAP